jgi:hypothetical protein
MTRDYTAAYCRCVQPYEFDDKQDEVIAALARAMINVAMVTLFGGAITLTRSILLSLAVTASGHGALGLVGLGSSVGELVISALLVIAGRKLILIPRTEGEDMPNLISGLDTLSTTYLLQGLTFAAIAALVVWAAVTL